jgi:hypothetical protein
MSPERSNSAYLAESSQNADIDPSMADDDEGTVSELRPPGRRQVIHYRSLSDAVLFTLIIAGPTMLWEEMWRAKPMIDQTGDLWIAPAVIVGVTYFLGGSIAGRHRRRPMGAVVQGLALAIPTSLVLIFADLGRRLVLKKGLPLSVLGLWLLAIIATVVIASVGALFGRWLYRARRKRRSPVAGTH